MTLSGSAKTSWLSTAARYGGAVAVPIALLAVSVVLPPSMSVSVQLALLCPAIVVLAVYAGLAPAVLCLTLSVVATAGWLSGPSRNAEVGALAAGGLATGSMLRRKRAGEGLAQSRQNNLAIEERVRQLTDDLERRLAERTKADRQLVAEHAVTRILSQASNLNEVGPPVLQAICENLGFEVGQLWQPDSSDGRLHCRQSWACDGARFDHFQQASRAVSFESGVGLPGRVWSSNAPAWIQDVVQDKNFPRARVAALSGLHSGCAFPILNGSDFFGVMEFFGSNIAEPDKALLNMMSAVGSEIGQFIRRRGAEQELALHRDRLEELVTRRTAELELTHQRLRASERMASLGTLTTGLGHDMGNLVFPMLCRLDALASENLSERAKNEIEQIRESVLNLRRLSHGLNLFALDPEDPSASTGSTSIHSWWAETGRLLQKTLPKDVALQSEFESDLPPVAIAPHQLTQAVRNLITNAGEAVGRDGLVRITSKRSDDGKRVELCIADNGRGMIEEVRKHALEPFFTTKKRSLSTGLGLSTVRGIVQSVGGSIAIESAPGQGTRVKLSLRPISEVESERRSSGNSLVAHVSLRDRRFASYAAMLLESASFNVLSNGPAGDDNERLWITEPVENIDERVSQFLDHRPDRRVILVGDSTRRKWNQPGVVVVDGSHRAMHKALQTAVIELTNEEFRS